MEVTKHEELPVVVSDEDVYYEETDYIGPDYDTGWQDL